MPRNAGEILKNKIDQSLISKQKEILGNNDVDFNTLKISGNTYTINDVYYYDRVNYDRVNYKIFCIFVNNDDEYRIVRIVFQNISTPSNYIQIKIPIKNTNVEDKVVQGRTVTIEHNDFDIETTQNQTIEHNDFDIETTQNQTIESIVLNHEQGNLVGYKTKEIIFDKNLLNNFKKISIQAEVPIQRQGEVPIQEQEEAERAKQGKKERRSTLLGGSKRLKKSKKSKIKKRKKSYKKRLTHS